MKLFGKAPWKQQPQIPVGINWSNPITRGLVFATADGKVNAATGKKINWSNSDPTKSGGQAGLFIEGNGSRYADLGITLANSPLTLFSTWLSRTTSQYAAVDADRVVFSTRTAGNAGFSWGRNAATGGGAGGNVTRNTHTVQGVAQYFASALDIPSLVSTAVAVTVSGTTLKHFTAGALITTTTIGAGTNGGNLIFLAQGPSGGVPWLDRVANGFAFNRALSDAEIKSLSDNPWQIFQPLGRNLGCSPSAGGNPALTGQAAVATQGTLTPVMDAVLSGNASAAGQGVLSATLLLPLTGQATSAEQGGVAPVITVALTGLGATAATGTLTVSGSPDITLALTGQATAVAQGSLLAAATTALSGQSTSIAQGTVLPQIDKTLTGQAVALAQGSVLPQTSVALLGHGVSVAQGAMVAPGDLTVALMGVGVTVGQGALTASITPDPGNGKSGVNRMWLIEYYTKEFAKKAPIAVPEEIVGAAAKRNALNRAKAVRAKQIEALAAKAERDLEVLAQGVEDARAAQQFTYNLIHQAQRQPEPEIDFMRVADSYRKRMKQEDDDLMLFAMVI